MLLPVRTVGVQGDFRTLRARGRRIRESGVYSEILPDRKRRASIHLEKGAAIIH